MTRHDGRRPDQLRELDLQPDFLEQPHGSILYAQGRTVVLCAATLDEGVPRWLRGKGTGWVTAEYSMLPRATAERTDRESPRAGSAAGPTRSSGSSAARCAASSTSPALGERTITVDCDVLQADGGTRTASITGGYVALRRALDRYGMERLRRPGSPRSRSGSSTGCRCSTSTTRGLARPRPTSTSWAGGRAPTSRCRGRPRASPFDRELLDRLLDLAAGGIAQLEAAQRDACEAPSLLSS